MDKSFLENIKSKHHVSAEKQFKESIKAKISEKLATVKASLTKTISENAPAYINPGLNALAAKKKKEAEAKKAKKEDLDEDDEGDHAARDKENARLDAAAKKRKKESEQKK